MRKLLSTVLAFSLTASVTVSSAGAAYIHFKDVPRAQSHWAYDTIQWAANRGIVSGYNDGTFRPNQQVTEAEFLTLLLNNFRNVELSNLTTTGHWADRYYEYAQKASLPLTNERSKPITRGHVAQLVTSSFGFDYHRDRAIQFLYDERLSEGTTGKKTIADYKAGEPLTRAEAVQFLRNIHTRYNSGQTFVGLTPIEGEHAELLTRVKTFIHSTTGLDIQLRPNTGGFNIIKPYPVGSNMQNETVITYFRALNEKETNYLYVNKLEPELLLLSVELLRLVGLPVDDRFASRLDEVGHTSATIKLKIGSYDVELVGDAIKKQVEVRYKIRNN